MNESTPIDLLSRIRIACVAACTCMTKTPAGPAHEDICRYRVLLDCEAEIARLRELDTEHTHSVNLRWKADMRAIKRWQAATGRDMTWPDHADLVVWLLERLDAAEAAKP